MEHDARPAPPVGSPALAAPGADQARRAAAAGLLGTFIEYYDFAVYAFLVLFIAPLFFPGGDPTAAVLSALAVYAVGFVIRPLGGLFFGSLGDRFGRRRVLVATVAGMGLATTVMGVLPTYASVGVFAPILLVLTRGLQGFCAGGEIAGSATFVLESTGRRRRGLLQSVTPIGSSLGVAAAPAVVGLVSAIVGQAAMAAWGWRVPLLLSAILTAVVVAYRTRLRDTPEFARVVAVDDVAVAPVRQAWGFWRTIAGVAALVLAFSMSATILQTYMNIYLTTAVRLPQTTVYWLSAAALAAGVVGIPAGGLLVDRIGVRRTALLGFIGSGLLAYPVMLIMAQAGTGVWVIGAVYAALLLVNNLASAPVFTTLTTSFPTQVRYTSSAAGWNLGSILGGGIAPYLAGLSVALSGVAVAPAFLVLSSGVLGAIVVVAVAARYGSGRTDRSPSG